MNKYVTHVGGVPVQNMDFCFFSSETLRKVAERSWVAALDALEACGIVRRQQDDYAVCDGVWRYYSLQPRQICEKVCYVSDSLWIERDIVAFLYTAVLGPCYVLLVAGRALVFVPRKKCEARFFPSGQTLDNCVRCVTGYLGRSDVTSNNDDMALDPLTLCNRCPSLDTAGITVRYVLDGKLCTIKNEHKRGAAIKTNGVIHFDYYSNWQQLYALCAELNIHVVLGAVHHPIHKLLMPGGLLHALEYIYRRRAASAVPAIVTAAHRLDCSVSVLTPHQEPKPETHASTPSASSGSCCVCFATMDKRTAFSPCGHVCCCAACVETIMKRDKKCPLCRAGVALALPLFFV